jgi:hypothetical protein
MVSVGMGDNTRERCFVMLVAAVHRTAMAIGVNRRYLRVVLLTPRFSEVT